MTVYIIAQITIHNREQYDRYDAAFMGVFEQFDGTMLSVDEAPMVLEGSWTATRSVLISFPSAESAKAWMRSKAYRTIARDRVEASVANSIMVAGLEDESN